MNTDLVGHRYPITEEYVVTRERIGAFAHAIGDQGLWYHRVGHARGLGYRDVLAPPTFTAAMATWLCRPILLDPALGLDLARVTTGSQAVVHHRPVVAGDRLWASVTVTDVRNLARFEAATWQIAFHDATGLPVCTWDTTILQRVTGPWPTPRPPAGQSDDRPGVATRRLHVTRAQVVAFCGVTGDFAPIHYSDRAARAAGLAGVVAHGLLVMSVAARAITDWAGDPAALVACQARFARVLPVPDDAVGAALDIRLVPETAADSCAPTVFDLDVRYDGLPVLADARATMRHPSGPPALAATAPALAAATLSASNP